jgi:hypothetical protein
VTETDKEIFTTNFNQVDDQPFPVEDIYENGVNSFPSLAETQVDIELANQRFLQLLSDNRQIADISFKYCTVKIDTPSLRRPVSNTTPARPTLLSASRLCFSWL